MSHLTDQQLVECLYGESEVNPAAVFAHLESCGECRSRMQSLEAVLARLNSFNVPAQEHTPGPAAVLQRLAGTGATVPADSPVPAPATVQASSPVSAAATPRAHASVPGRRDRMHVPPVVAASVLLLVTCLGFLGGMRFQSHRLAADLESLVDQAVRSQLQQTVLDRIPPQPATDDFRENSSPGPGSLMLARFEQALAGLAGEQMRLRKDLETLAINAEAELLTTNRELQAATRVLGRLQQFANTRF